MRASPSSSFDQNFTDQNFGNQNFAKANFADASFPESQGFDASFPDTSFPSAHGFAQQEPATDYGRGAQADQGFDSFHNEPSQDYGQVPQSDPRRQLQAFDAIYDQPPQISLGSTEPNRRPAQDFYEGERLDADFLDEGQAIPAPGARAKSGMTFKGRSAFMVGSALLGAIALGGALAFAYKQSGGGLGSDQPPLVTADSRPVKELPDDPGGKDFPHKNKLIYDRLQNGDEPESERLVPRQENVAVPALPPSPDSGGMPASVATTDLATPTTQAVGGAEPVAVASADDSMPDGGPRKVKTMVVRPDGTMAEPPADAAAAEAPAAPDAARACCPRRATRRGCACGRRAARGCLLAGAAGSRCQAEARRQACRADRCRDACGDARSRRRPDQICRAGRLEEEPDRRARELRRYAAEISDAARQLPADGAEGRSRHQGNLVPLAHRPDCRQDHRHQALRTAEVARPA